MLILVHVVYELNAQSGNLKAASLAVGVGARRPRLTGVSVVLLELVAAVYAALRDCSGGSICSYFCGRPASWWQGVGSMINTRTRVRVCTTNSEHRSLTH